MVLDGALGAAGDEDHVGDAGGDRLFDRILDQRLVDDRQHFLGAGLGRRQETRSQAGDRKYGFGDFFHYLTLLFKQLRQFDFIENGNAEFLRLVELAAGFFAGHHVIRLLRHRTGHLAAGGLDQRLGLLACQRRQRAGQHQGLAGQRLPAASLPARPPAMHPGPAQAGNHFPVMRFGKELAMLCATIGPTSGTAAAHPHRPPAALPDCRSDAPDPWQSPRRHCGCPARK